MAARHENTALRAKVRELERGVNQPGPDRRTLTFLLYLCTCYLGFVAVLLYIDGDRSPTGPMP